MIPSRKRRGETCHERASFRAAAASGAGGGRGHRIGLGAGRDCERAAGGPGLSQPAGPLRRSGGARRADRRHGAGRRDAVVGPAGPAGDRRQPGRRRRQHRCRAGSEVAGRRLHAADRLHRVRGQRQPVPRSGLRCLQGLPADHRARFLAQRHPRAPVVADRLDRRSDRAGARAATGSTSSTLGRAPRRI